MTISKDCLKPGDQPPSSPTSGLAGPKTEVVRRRGPSFAGDGSHILVVDDEAIARSVAKRVLEKFGFQVLVARGAREAVGLFSERRSEIQAVLLDMNMPEMTGEEVLAEMQQICPEVCVVLSSGYNEKSVLARFVGRGLAGFVQKPYQPMALVGKLRDVLKI